MNLYRPDRAQNNNYDTAILISGDGDFDSAIYSVKNLGKRVKNAYLSIGISDQLKKACDRFILLDKEFLKDCFMK